MVVLSVLWFFGFLGQFFVDIPGLEFVAMIVFKMSWMLTSLGVGMMLVGFAFPFTFHHHLGPHTVYDDVGNVVARW
jgi:hypothetical protein